MPGQVVVVDADAVEVNGRIVAADRDTDRVCLRKIVIGRILRHTGHDAVDIAIDEPVLSLLLNDEGQTNVLVFFVLRKDLRLLGLKNGLLGRQREAAPAAHAGEHHGVVIHDVPCGKLHLYGLAGGAAVLCKGPERNVQTGIACHTEDSSIILVQLPAVRTEVETRKYCVDIAVAPAARILFLVAAAVAGEIQRKVLGFRFHLDLAGRDRQGDGFGGRAAGNLQRQSARVVCTVRPDLPGAVDGLAGDLRAVCRQHDLRRQAFRVIHGIRNCQ